MLALHPNTRLAAESAILISGSARSGTTIIGKLIHSFEGIEYVFEPPSLIALFSIIEYMPEEQWKFLYEAYLYEEFLINAVSGRAINTNLADDSSIYSVKSARDIDYRLNHSWSKGEAANVAAHRRIAYKIPNIVPFIPQLRAYYPSTTIILMQRGALETIHSLIAKYVFRPGHPNSALPWPTRTDQGQEFPYWIKPGDEALWTELNELDRCAYYYIRMNEGLELLNDQLLLNYSTLVSRPREVAQMLAERLGVGFGERTDSVIDSIKRSGKPLDTKLLDGICEQLRGKVIEYSAQSE